MRELFLQLTRELKSFLDQSDDLLLLLACSSDDTALVLKTMRDLEQADASDVFLLHADDFAAPGPFITSAIDRLADDHQRANVALANLQRDPLPPLPGTLKDPTRPPSVRLQQALEFARTLLPGAIGHRIAWAMLPGGIADDSSYLQLIRECSAERGLQPWMRNVRLIFRVTAGFALAASPLANIPRLRLRRVDFGPPALSHSLKEEAEDPKAPEADRMNASLSLATLDYAHGRIPEAVARYQTLYAFALKSDNATMQALVLTGLGDTARKQGDTEMAQHWYECATKPAVVARQPVVLATLLNNLASIAYERKEYIDAEVYYDNLSTIQTWLMDPVGKLQALEGRGLAQAKQSKTHPALASFEEAALLGVGFALPAPVERNLKHLQRLSKESGNSAKLAEVEAELARAHA